jgi:hypothetical protein
MIDLGKFDFRFVVARSPRFSGDAATQTNQKTAVSGTCGWPRRLKKSLLAMTARILSLFAKVEIMNKIQRFGPFVSGKIEPVWKPCF